MMTNDEDTVEMQQIFPLDSDSDATLTLGVLNKDLNISCCFILTFHNVCNVINR